MPDDFTTTFASLRALLEPYAVDMSVTADGPEGYSLDTRHVMANGNPLFFGAVKISKSYVSYHLMPVYVEPALLESISPDLKKRMQGKSCFNFRTVDTPQLSELERLTHAGHDLYAEKGMLA